MNTAQDNKAFQIDIDQILAEKLPDKKLPSFAVRYLKRITHQDEINLFLQESAGKKDVDFIEAALEYLEATYEVIGEENLPPSDEGRYIFASNHPLGGLDALAVGAVLGKKYGDKLKYFANDILMFLEPMSGMFMPVNKGGKSGSSPREMVKMVDDFFRSDNHLITFPSGAGSRKIDGKIQDIPWQKTFVSKAVEHERDVVPIYFEGRNSNFFYNLSRIRTKLGLPNIEMLYLVNEMYKQRGKHFRVVIGKPISYKTFDKSRNVRDWAAWVREEVYKMGEEQLGKK